MITKETLEKLDACPEGVKWFSARYPEGFDLSGWTQEEQVSVLKNGGAPFIGWAVREKIIPLWSLSGVDLSGANLSGADLPGADLCRANLSGANLFGADLRRANLFGANLRRANLSGADLRCANLFGAANLSGANLSDANLSDADLSDAILSRAEGL